MNKKYDSLCIFAIMGETTKEVEDKAKIEEARQIFAEVFLHISNQPKRSLPPPLSRDFIDNDGDDDVVCMNCCENSDDDVDDDWDDNQSPEILHGPGSFPKKENQIPIANDLLKLFNVYGPVTKVEIPTDKTTGILWSCQL
ncbi:hypothetical protein FRX31_009557 [Thalictrum thalictroides]|uniref:Uncharacterized protein n=1 Tax=Thalictrum thalictroides TaxID=46969 RepID=A0A7J6WTW5_THATH|nr:hypothetical protein FRX31_009557 [Thalictrum thalictroides]